MPDKVSLKLMRYTLEEGGKLDRNESLALLSIAEAAQARVSAGNAWEQAGELEASEYTAAYQRVLDTAKALRAALAEVEE